MTGRELDLGLLGLAEFLPLALAAPFTGALADRATGVASSPPGSPVVTTSIGLFLYVSTDPREFSQSSRWSSSTGFRGPWPVRPFVPSPSISHRPSPSNESSPSARWRSRPAASSAPSPQDSSLWPTSQRPTP